MTTAQKHLELIKDKENRINSVIRAVAMIFKSLTLFYYDETENGEQVNTFIFTFYDDSVLKIDFDGDVYIDDDYENAYNIYK
jgi:hypothetical protein